MFFFIRIEDTDEAQDHFIVARSNCKSFAFVHIAYAQFEATQGKGVMCVLIQRIESTVYVTCITLFEMILVLLPVTVIFFYFAKFPIFFSPCLNSS